MAGLESGGGERGRQGGGQALHHLAGAASAAAWARRSQRVGQASGAGQHTAQGHWMVHSVEKAVVAQGQRQANPSGFSASQSLGGGAFPAAPGCQAGRKRERNAPTPAHLIPLPRPSPGRQVPPVRVVSSLSYYLPP